jgi:DNA-binding NarL/FixJ family response regulator
LFNRSPILIVEDEPFVALELAAAVEEAGGVVVGPVGSARAALTLVQSCPIAVAILDVHLTGRDVTPVLKRSHEIDRSAVAGRSDA